MTKKGKRLYLHLTDRCNLSCKHCSFGSRQKKNKFLSWGQIKQSLLFFYKRGFNSVEITGGESCLSPFFEKTIFLAKKIGYKCISVSSNGTFPGIVKKFSPSDIQRFTFSLDGTTETADEFLRGKEHYKKCLWVIKEAIAKGFEVYVIQCVHKKNYKEIEKTIALMERVGVSRLSFNHISRRGNAKKNQELIISPRQWIKFREKLQVLSVFRRKIILRFPVRFATASNYPKLLENNYCCPLENPKQVIVTPDGLIYYCCFLTGNKNLSAGKVTKNLVNIERKDLSLLRKYPKASCPAYEEFFLDEKTKGIVPICVYKKIIL